jgi:hypothetical protein
MIVLSDGRRLGTCPEDDGGLYVVDGKKSKVPILSVQVTPLDECCIPGRREHKKTTPRRQRHLLVRKQLL